MTTRPFLVLDLMKSKDWKEAHHPRDKNGKFTQVRGGSRVETKAGKQGTVRKVTDTHYLVEYDDGKKSKVAKGNVLHANDIKKPARKKKAAAPKPKAVEAKAQKPAAKKTKPAAKKETAPKKAAPKKTVAAKATTASKAKANGSAPVAQADPTHTTVDRYGNHEPLTVAVGGKGNKRTGTVKEQEAGIKEFMNAEKTLPKESGLDTAWTSKPVQNLLSKPVGKRSGKKIAEVAGKITNDNDKLAHALVNRRLKAMGLPQSKNKIGNAVTKNPFTYETGLHGDMLQSARGAMYETLVATLSGTQNPGGEIGAHVVNRMKDKITNDLYGMLNAIPAPHEIRPAIRAMKAEEPKLMQQLGRTPTDAELANHLEAVSDHFKTAPINAAPRFDEKTGNWLATKARISDPTERLQMLRQYDSIQRTASADRNIGTDGEKEVTITQNAKDEARTPDELYERKERQAELENTLPNAMRRMGMSDAMVHVWSLTHSGASGNKSQYSGTEVADMINANGGWDGKPVSRSWVAARYSEGRKVIEEALKANHPALEQLKMLKSFVFDEMLKGIHEYNLLKALHAWGFDHTILEREFVRTASGRNLYDIKKSLAPDEYIGSVVTVDSGQVHARITRNAVPKGEALVKAFRDFEALEKALFPHKDGGNHAVNEQAKKHIQANAGKYKGMASEQAARIQRKTGKVTWSEQLVLDNPGSAWIRWGGKRILINSGTGDVVFDSRNDAHREEKQAGVPEEKLEFQHEVEEHEAASKALKAKANEDHKAGKYTLDGGRSMRAWADHHGVKYTETKGEGKKKEIALDLDADGNLQFDHSKKNFHVDHGTEAFEANIGDLANHIKEHKAATVDSTHHKLVSMHHKWDESQKDAYNNASPEERARLISDFVQDNAAAMQLITEAQVLARNGMNGKDIAKKLAEDMKQFSRGKKADEHGLAVLGNAGKMVPVFNAMGRGDALDSILEYVGRQEISRAREEANKKMLPEGHYEVGNKSTGKSLVVKIGHREDPETGKFTSYVQEAFDPKTGKHFTSEGVENSWGQLGRELGLTNNSAESFIYDSNKAGKDAVITTMDDAEAAEHRSKTTAGLRDAMVHKDFAKVDEVRGKDGKVTSTTYAQDMPDGTQNVVEVGADGYIKDPIMARLIQNNKPIKSADDLHEALQGAVGNTAWVTAHAGSDVHIGDALGHHVKLQYDGKGAPRVTGGAYDGYRFMDSKDIPKGAIDPATGEPIKTLFKNGKLVDRKFTNQNDLEIKRGNAVMYPDGETMRRGRVKAVREDGTHEIHDHQGNLIGLFDKKELRPAKAAGRTLADSGKAVVKLKESNAHRMNPGEVFEDGSKQKALFEQALKKAGIKAFDKDGALHKELDLSDKEHAKLKKVLGRSKAGKAMLKEFRKTKLPSELELHVPEHHRAAIEAEGVAVAKDGKAIISAGKFEHLRDVLGGLSLDHKAQEYLRDHFKRKDRTPRPLEDLKKDYQPSQAVGAHADAFREQFKPDSFLMNPEQGLYGTQLEGVAHLVERGRGIAGHGINSTLAVTFMLQSA